MSQYIFIFHSFIEETLDLPLNDISGTIPSEIGLMSNLNWLSLSNNALTGTIPLEINSMPDLGKFSRLGGFLRCCGNMN